MKTRNEIATRAVNAAWGVLLDSERDHPEVFAIFELPRGMPVLDRDRAIIALVGNRF